ncbi:hypothetical protein [Fibrobacter sp. UBA4309]|uniref:hypothetical protein n=1 Tax=Fibrobacter sp. UBA4309 TaxID=1946537 RepID=UPI0025C23A66|nr:hypothetical protein [Fibrobacter sp. UBA4309]
MKTYRKFVMAVFGGFLCGNVSLTGCGSDSASEPDDVSPIPGETSSMSADLSSGDSANSSPVESGTSQGSGVQSSAQGSQNPNSSSVQMPNSVSSSAHSQQTVPSSSSKKTETVSSDEILNNPNNVVNGSCQPKNSVIARDSMATWEFLRSQGDVFDQILAPYIWTFSDGKTLQGNGLNTVNVTYKTSGTVTAKLSVDGNEVECSPLQVQGDPIVISSCKASTTSAKAGDVVTWTVEATSESPITGYAWTSTTEGAEVNGTGATASATATSAMHKKNLEVSVAVTNEDKTTETFACERVSVTDPNQVDVVIAHTNVDSTKVFPGSQTIVAQYPSNAVNCQMVCNTDGNGVKLIIDEEEFTIDYSLNISPKNCTAGSAAGTKITVQASMNVYCYVTY